MNKLLNRTLQIFALIFALTILAYSQTEVLTNADVIAMSKAKLSSEVIIEKIKTADANFDVTTKALIELKTESVEDAVIAAVVKRAEETEKLKTREVVTTKSGETDLSEAAPEPTRDINYKTPAQLLREAKTIAFKKTSIYPKKQDLENSLLKNSRKAKWDKFGLIITRYEADADLVVEISNDFLTNYDFRVVDVKTGRVITASGVTSLGGALAGNVADKLIKRFNEVLASEN